MLTSKVKAHEITDLQRFETLSHISLIEQGNRLIYNDTLSLKSSKLFSDVLMSMDDRIPLTGDITVGDRFTQIKLAKEIGHLCTTADRQKSIANLRLTPTLDSLLETNDKRFGLLTITTGFTRAKGNYGRQVAKGVGLGILTLGTVYTSPIKASSTVYVMIVDSKDNNVAFFRKSLLGDAQPLEEKILRKQVQQIFNGYFWVVD